MLLPVSSILRPLGPALAAVLLLAACGGSKAHTQSVRLVTLPAYDNYPTLVETIPAGASPRSPQCRAGARALVTESLQFLAHSNGRSAYPADLAYSQLRTVFLDFQGRHCDPALLAGGLRTRLTAAQRRQLLADLPALVGRVLAAALQG